MLGQVNRDTSKPTEMLKIAGPVQDSKRSCLRDLKSLECVALTKDV